MRSSCRLAVTVGLLAAATAGPAQAAPTPRAVWDMDSLPTKVDSTGGDANGTSGAMTSGGSGRYVFTGTSSLATVPDKANLDPGAATSG